MKRILSCFGFCLALFLGAAQAHAQKLDDVVYTKDGSIVRGTIVEQIPGKSLKIRTSDGSVFHFRTSDVAKITKEQSLARAGLSDSRPTGYRGFVDIGGVIGTGEDGDAVFSLTTSHGYQVNPYFFVGGGLGVEHHFDYEKTFIPLFVDLRTYFIPNSISPYLDVKFGYAPAVGSDDYDLEFKGGAYLNPSLGVTFSVNSQFAMNLSVGYNLQWLKYTSYIYTGVGDYYYSFKGTTLLGGVSLKLGFEF